MKLSEAILEGVRLDGKQIKRDYFSYDSNGEVVGCCALGAALIGADPKRKETGLRPFRGEFFELFPEAVRTVYNCPSKACKYADEKHIAIDMVVHLNDRHGWKRESIAKWLKGIGL